MSSIDERLIRDWSTLRGITESTLGGYIAVDGYDDRYTVTGIFTLYKKDVEIRLNKEKKELDERSVTAHFEFYDKGLEGHVGELKAGRFTFSQAQCKNTEELVAEAKAFDDAGKKLKGHEFDDYESEKAVILYNIDFTPETNQVKEVTRVLKVVKQYLLGETKPNYDPFEEEIVWKHQSLENK